MDQFKDPIWQVARRHRQQLRGRVIAVAGGLGKTTTQQLIDVVLRGQFSGSAPHSDVDDAYALPQSLLELNPQDQYGVLEIRGCGKEEIRDFSHLCQPEIGVINSLAQNVSPRGDADECGELELLAQLPEHGWAVLSGDEPQLRDRAVRARSAVVLVGRSSHSDLIATDVRWSDGWLRFVVAGTECQVRAWGRHTLHAALAAYAVGRIFGLSAQDVAARLGEYQPLPQRCQVVCRNRVLVIDDTYGGGYASWPAALEVLRELDTTGRRIVICGDVADPDCGFGRPADIGRAVIEQGGADWLIAIGPQGRMVVDAAQAAGMPSRRTMWRPRVSEAVSDARDLVRPGDVVLVKSGRNTELGQLVSNLLDGPLAAVA